MGIVTNRECMDNMPVAMVTNRYQVECYSLQWAASVYRYIIGLSECVSDILIRPEMWSLLSTFLQ